MFSDDLFNLFIYLYLAINSTFKWQIFWKKGLIWFVLHLLQSNFTWYCMPVVKWKQWTIIPHSLWPYHLQLNRHLSKSPSDISFLQRENLDYFSFSVKQLSDYFLSFPFPSLYCLWFCKTLFKTKLLTVMTILKCLQTMTYLCGAMVFCSLFLLH